MTQQEFEELAQHMGAQVAFRTAPVAVFKGPKFCITLELETPALETTRPAEVAYVMAELDRRVRLHD
jgi:hypothetical protein